MYFLDWVQVVAFFFMIYSAVIWLLLLAQKRKEIFEKPVATHKPFVSLLIPAYNEEERIAKCIRSMLKLNYPKNRYEIIVVNDGSTDMTGEICRAYEKKGLIKLVSTRHLGRAGALNQAMKHVKGELIATMDADSWADPDFLVNSIGFFNEPDVAVVTPAMKVGLRETIVQKIQWMEYLFSIFMRKMFCFNDCQYVTPGPGSVYRANLLKKEKFDASNLTEDMEIAFRLFSKGHKIKNSINSVVFTDIPRSFAQLLKQRIRWYRGYLQNVVKYKFMLFNRKYGNLGWFLIPVNFIWLFVMFILALVAIWISGQGLMTGLNVYGLVGGDVAPYLRFTGVDWHMMNIFTIFSALFITLSMATIGISLKLSKERVSLAKNWVEYLSFMFIYPVMLLIFWLASIFQELRGAENKW